MEVGNDNIGFDYPHKLGNYDRIIVASPTKTADTNMDSHILGNDSVA